MPKVNIVHISLASGYDIEVREAQTICIQNVTVLIFVFLLGHLLFLAANKKKQLTTVPLKSMFFPSSLIKCGVNIRNFY